MADFSFHQKHLPPQPYPEPGLIEGTLNPLIDGPGDYRIRVSEFPSGRLIAGTTASSPDGNAVPVQMTHAEKPGAGQSEPLQRNVTVQIGDEPPRSPVPIWLRQAGAS